jgi:adenine-specific DNA-methyltransferase
LNVLKRILESKIFWYYIVNTSKPYSSGYYSLSKNYLRNFSIPDLSVVEKDQILRGSKNSILNLLLRKYDLEMDELKRSNGVHKEIVEVEATG